ncbi:zinc ABC transporter substrate-binding protein [Candidatus Saccharibacteria bacterium]|nr:zinc ABC transporter substrate-binding protein [Candidatus Saccharibacteria bacterium]
MNRTTKKLLLGILGLSVAGLGIFGIVKFSSQEKNEATILASSFIGYDFARAVVGDSDEIEMLIKPGVELHDFEPTPEDIKKIKEAKLFIYVGGESEGWIEEILKDNGIPEEKTLKLIKFVELEEEDEFEGGVVVEKSEEDEENKEGGVHEENEVEYDEHIWTSPINSMKLVRAIEEKLVEVFPEDKEKFRENSEEYVGKLEKLDEGFREVVKNGDKDEIVFGDKFPFKYFVEEYGLRYYAAFPGCSEQTEADSKTVGFLINKVREDKIGVVLKIELSSGKLAETIANETGAKVLELNSAHNVSREDFESGLTYVEILEKNLEVLREALN